ncbi:PLD nuclease N-terminal domain-containing protein [Corynebacterium mastitidis]|uniref:Transcriptional regulator n=1 Tax=Corynebacterium mastitidis TaxID=161890 RepID=A0A2N0X7E5_9CORY|nr:PLD nuclease N-terminal domain-containing protein [Corynebacterium mastitidis]MCH6197613.1 PLD nuclease N-terminal domain-containing protein [Corynebacterium mastitidis]PKF68607.1 transcriptional regulator [Corynebacterium mastitidis]
MTAALLIPIVFIALPLAAIVLLVTDGRPGSETALWALVIVAAPFLGPVIYLLWRAKGKSERKERV